MNSTDHEKINYIINIMQKGINNLAENNQSFHRFRERFTSAMATLIRKIVLASYINNHTKLNMLDRIKIMCYKTNDRMQYSNILVSILKYDDKAILFLKGFRDLYEIKN